MVTFANGNDNLGIYFPLFASRSPARLGGYGLFFYLGGRGMLFGVHAHPPGDHCGRAGTVRRADFPLCADRAGDVYFLGKRDVGGIGGGGKGRNVRMR